jgi:hypothetical protein
VKGDFPSSNSSKHSEQQNNLTSSINNMQGDDQYYTCAT